MDTKKLGDLESGLAEVMAVVERLGGGPVTIAQISDRLDVCPRTVRRRVRVLVDRRLLARGALLREYRPGGSPQTFFAAGSEGGER